VAAWAAGLYGRRGGGRREYINGGGNGAGGGGGSGFTPDARNGRMR
jgi:hypothetical protein